MDLKPELMAEIDTYKLQTKSEFKFRIPLKFKEHEIDGLDWACGYIARRMKYVQGDILGDYAFNCTTDHAKPAFITRMNRGGATVPTKTWRTDYRFTHLRSFMLQL